MLRVSVILAEQLEHAGGLPVRRAPAGKTVHRARLGIRLHRRRLVVVERAPHPAAAVGLPPVVREDFREREAVADLGDLPADTSLSRQRRIGDAADV